MKEKSVDAYRSIGEVSKMLGVATHVLRSWEEKFPHLSSKRISGRRQYSKKDCELLRYIHTKIYEDGYSVSEVKELLKKNKKSEFSVNAVTGGVIRAVSDNYGLDNYEREEEFCERISSLRGSLILE